MVCLPARLPVCLSVCLPACPCDTQGAQRCNRRSRQGAGDTARKVRGEWPLVEGAWTRSSAQFSECSETKCLMRLPHVWARVCAQCAFAGLCEPTANHVPPTITVPPCWSRSANARKKRSGAVSTLQSVSECGWRLRTIGSSGTSHRSWQSSGCDRCPQEAMAPVQSTQQQQQGGPGVQMIAPGREILVLLEQL